MTSVKRERVIGDVSGLVAALHKLCNSKGMPD